MTARRDETFERVVRVVREAMPERFSRGPIVVQAEGTRLRDDLTIGVEHHREESLRRPSGQA